ncbi:hypothetical protein LCI18_014017 [Fusarium solani-melongenae]|uniref:Uncharacterized protein n=1 Tax=Fusarium solani subsp. cucurbitae TaxID=2747967 RepID=A0ACD3ZPF4_FUSSC|nr:hypothetical protein LCI18_014017 [Fusarium solani-melongenae]
MTIIRSLLFLAPLLFFSNLTLGDDFDTPLGTPSPISVETTRFIVKFSGSAKFKRDEGDAGASEFYSVLQDSGQDVTPSLVFDSEVFRGVSFDVKNATNNTLAEIEALPEVAKIWPAAFFHLPVEGSAAVADSDLRLTYPAWSVHNDTNVAAMHQAGHFGEDVVIAIVDSGIDYTHPAFGGGFGPGYRVEAGYDLVGDDYVAGGEYKPDDDPMDCLGHGTHVAGIAASGDSYLPGVAPKARLHAYKVFGCGDGTYEDTIVAAFLKAYDDGADVINASLGSNRGFPDSPTALIASTIAAAGVLVVFAAGNSGSTGPFYTSSGGNGVGSLAVGSVQAEDWVAYQFTATSSSGETRDIAYLSDTLKQFNLNGTFAAFTRPDVREKTACTWDQLTGPKDSVMVIPLFNTAAVILFEDGDWIMSQAEAGYDVTFEFIYNNQAISIPRSGFAGGRINDFSSWGPTLDARMKPEISAPGGSILSTWPVSSGSWATYSGTSMASPYIAGVGALFFGSRGGRSALGPKAAQMAVDRIIASGRPVQHNDGTSNPASVVRQGAGIVDAASVILSGTSVSPANLNLNDTVHFNPSHQVVLTNSNDETVTYQVTHEAGITVHTKGNGDAWVSNEPSYSSDEGEVVTVSLSDDTFTLGAGESATLHLEFVEPATVSASYLPVYGGRILFGGSNGEVVSVTYMGIKGSIYASDTWEMDRGVPMWLSGYGGLMEEGYEYSFEAGSDVFQPYFNILWSTREIGFDFVTRDWEPSNWVYPPVAGKNNWIGSVRTRPSGLNNEIINFPLVNYPRVSGSFYVASQGYFANGSSIPDGEYRILGRAVRTFGDLNSLDDWQYALSPWFSVKRDINPTDTTTSEVASATTLASSVTSDATTTFEAPVCTTGGPRAVSLTAYVGDAEDGYKLYLYSDFLATDLRSEQSPLRWELTEDGHLQSKSLTTSADIFAAVHTNTNSLVYMYPASRITGAWSHLACRVTTEGTLNCVSGEKDKFYICDLDAGLIRHGPTIVDGCTALTFKVEDLPDPCAATSVASVTSDTPITTTGSVLGSTTESSAESTLTASFVSSITTLDALTTSIATATSEVTTSTEDMITSRNTSVSWESEGPTDSTFTDSISTTGTFSEWSSMPSDLTTITESSTTSSEPSTTWGTSTYTLESSSSSESSAGTSDSSTAWDSTGSTSGLSTVSTLSSEPIIVSESTTTLALSTESESSAEIIPTSVSEPSESSRINATSQSATVSVTGDPDSSSHISAMPTSTTAETISSLEASTRQSSTESDSSVSSRSSNIPSSPPDATLSETSSGVQTHTQPLSSVSSTPADTYSTQTQHLTTSTIFTTNTITFTACPSSVKKCPVSDYTVVITTEIIAISTTVCPLSSTDEISWIASETKRLRSTGGLSAQTTAKTPLATVTRYPGGISYCPESFKIAESLYMATGESEEGPSTQLAKVSSYEWDSDSTRPAIPIQPAESKVYASLPTGEPPRSSTGALQSSVPGDDGSSQRPNGGQQPTNDGSARPPTLDTKGATIQPSGESMLRVSGTVTGAATGAGSTQLETTEGPAAVSNNAYRQSFNVFVIGATLMLSVFNLLLS